MLISELVASALSNLGIINYLSLLSLLFLFRHTSLPSTRTCGVGPSRRRLLFALALHGRDERDENFLG